MGRRRPQQTIVQLEAEERAAGREVIPCGLPADSGFEHTFAPVFQRHLEEARMEITLESAKDVTLTEPVGTIELDVRGGITAANDDEEWETLYFRHTGFRVLFHERSRKTGRARLRIKHSGRKPLFDSVYRFMVEQRTATALATAHTVTAERAALRKLRRHLDAAQWRSYTLSGSFREISRRSGLIYVIRRARPTIVTKLIFDGEGPNFEPIVTLCMHPLGYTTGSSAGMMCPSDDVIAHLLMIRSDEHHYWRKANHHTLDDPLSML